MNASVKLWILAFAAVCVAVVLVVVLLEMEGLATATSRVRLRDDDGDDDDDDGARTSTPRILLSRGDDCSDLSNPCEVSRLSHRDPPTKAYRVKAHDNDSGCETDSYALAPSCTPITNEFDWKIHRAAQAVGRLVLDGDIACSGVVLRNATNVYFLTAAHCLPNEAIISFARVELTNCFGTELLTDSRVFHINLQLNILILELDVGSVSIANYGWLVLRPDAPTRNYTVIIPHYTKSQNGKRITTASGSKPIHMELAISLVAGCLTTLPTSALAYVAPSMDSASIGAPLISVVDFAVVGVHVCGDCKTGTVNRAVSSQSIVADLIAHGRLLPEFLT